MKKKHISTFTVFVCSALGIMAQAAIANEPLVTLFSDDMQRIDSEIVGNGWVEIETSSKVNIVGGSLNFDANDDPYRPLVYHTIPAQIQGKITWAFDLNLQRSGAEGVYAFWMQLGEGLQMNETSPEDGGVVVNLKWGGPNTGLSTHEGLGHVVDGVVTQIATVSGNTHITVTVDLDNKIYSVEAAGRVVTNIAFENNVTIDTVRFFADSLNSANFTSRTIDNVVIVEGGELPANPEPPTNPEPPIVVNGSWQEILEANFDIAESFDTLADWKGLLLGGTDENKANMPKKLDGTNSIWDTYDYWAAEESISDAWIGFHGVDNVWRGNGKSLIMDIAKQRRGPGRFGLYFGNSNGGPADPYALSGTPDSGYDELHVFFMVKYPANAFPKNSDGVYTYYGYYKFGTVATGFRSIGDYEYSNVVGGPYGKNYLIPQWKISSEMVRLKMDWRNPFADNKWTTGTINQFLANEEWFGVEYYIKIGTPGEANGHGTAWLYDQSGKVTQIYDEERMIVPISVDGVGVTEKHKFNKWFFGGNLSFGDEIIAQGLDATYYVDDFIIDDQRIGLKYFNLLSGNNTDTTPPNPPDNLRLINP